MNGTAQGQGQELVYVPAHPLRDGQLEFEVRALPDGTAALPAFSTVRGLVHELGSYQPWVCVPMTTVRQAAALSGVSQVALDPTFSSDAWRWDIDGVAELGGGAQ